MSGRAAIPSSRWWPRRGGVIIAVILAALAAYYLGTAHAHSEKVTLNPTTQGSGPAAAIPTVPRTPLSAEQIYRSAAPSVVLITNYDAHAHKRALGSGFLISGGGEIATNYHVIRGAYQAEVRFADGTESSVSGVVGYSPARDVAVVQAEQPATAKPLPFGNSTSLRIGDALLAIGSPLGLERTLSQGILSARRGELLQMTTPISPGSSGGPVLNQFGRVVGISDAYMPAGENINFAVPIDWVKPYIGRSSQQTLADVAQENAVDVPLSLTALIPARQAKTVPLRVTENMADPELDLSFASHGGADNVIELRVVIGNRIVWDSGRVSSGQAQIDLPAPGSYQIVMDNSPSIVFARTVRLEGQLAYVK